jgi:hypothetical protein
MMTCEYALPRTLYAQSNPAAGHFAAFKLCSIPCTVCICFPFVQSSAARGSVQMQMSPSSSVAQIAWTGLCSLLLGWCRYMMDSKLVVISTTNKMFNTSLYDSLTPKSLVTLQPPFH